MDRDYFDFDTDCGACDGSGGGGELYDECPACDGTGTVNRLHSGSDGDIRIREFMRDDGIVERRHIPIRDDEHGGIEGKYGDWIPPTVSDSEDEDVKAQLRNDGLAGQPVGPDSGPDLSMDEAIQWLDEKGDDVTAAVFRQIRDEKAAAGGGP